MATDKKRIGRNIEEARHRAGEMHQGELAEAIGKSPSVVSAYEKGEVAAPVAVLEAIAEATGVTLTELVYGLDGVVTDPQPGGSPRSARQLLDLLMQRTPGIESIAVTVTVRPQEMSAE